MKKSGERLKVLFIVHNHPSVQPGGAETYALDLYQEMGRREEIEPLLLARVGPGPPSPRHSHPSTPFGRFEFDKRQYWVHTDTAQYDWLHLTHRWKVLLTFHFRDFLLAHRPDVVHVHHTLYLGPELLRVVKDTLPDAAIVYTLHDYRSICHRDGVMVRTGTEEPCEHASPTRCSVCFPDITPGTFFMRERFMKAHFEAVDVFLAPSKFLLEKYVEWGIPREAIRFHEFGRPAVEALPSSSNGHPKNRLGYFGRLSPYKGISPMLRAMKLLAEDEAPVRLRVHGANVDSSYRRELQTLAESTPNVTWVGQYQQDELPTLMARVDWVVLPSLWWESSPLVIQEAFQHGKPVICSGIGALREKVTDGVNGLYFRRGDPESLADTIRRATTSNDLWQRLHAGVPSVRSIQDDAESLASTYREMLASKA